MEFNVSPFESACVKHGRYVLANIETQRGLTRGDRVWQIAFGSGFKCNSAVWRALRSTNEQHDAWVNVKVSDDASDSASS